MLRTPYRHARLFSSTFLVVAAACGGDSLQLPSDGAATQLTLLSGGGQSGEVGQRLTDSVVIRVTDGEGRPVENQVIAFVALSSSGAKLLPDTAQTDATGRAVAAWQLGTQAGSQRAEVRIPGSGIKITLAALANPGPPDTLSLITGMDQAGRIGSTLPESLVVRLVDRFGNAIPGEVITWSAQYGSVSSSSVATDDQGRAGVEWQLGLKPGTQKAEAFYSRVPGSPATFQAHAYIGP